MGAAEFGMAFANLYWNCISQQLKETELEDGQDEAGGVNIPHSHSSPVFNSVKLSLLSVVASMFESKVALSSTRLSKNLEQQFGTSALGCSFWTVVLSGSPGKSSLISELLSS